MNTPINPTTIPNPPRAESHNNTNREKGPQPPLIGVDSGGSPGSIGAADSGSSRSEPAGAKPPYPVNYDPIIGHKVADLINPAALVNRYNLLHLVGHLAEILDGGHHSADIQCADRTLAKLGYKPDLAARACTKSLAFHAELKAVKEVVKAQKTARIKREARDRRPRQDPNGDDHPQNFRSRNAK